MTACLPMAISAAAQQDEGKSISVQDTRVVQTDAGTVSVAFSIHVGESVVEPKRSMIVRPLLKSADGRGEQSLPVIIIRGARAKNADENRAMTAAGVDSGGHFATANGTVLEYGAQVPWQDWMSGSQLLFTGINAGKGDPTEVNIGLVAENLLTEAAGTLYAATPAPTAATPQTAVPAVPATQPATQNGASSGGSVGDELAARYSFVEPVARYDEARNASSLDVLFDLNMPLTFGSSTPKEEDEMTRFVEMTRLGALYIEFDKGSNMASRGLGQNYATLVNLISSIRAIKTSSDSRVAQVVVVGFSAPEGEVVANSEKETLAVERAGVVRDFITANSTLESGLVNIYNGSMDWVTLRALVAESNMRDKYSVLEIIDNVPAWGNTQTKGRMAHLAELNKGATMKYIRENFFPKLRQTGAYVKVYYENAR